MKYVLFIIFIVLFLTDAAYCRYNKLAGSVETYYKGGSTTTTNNTKLSSFSEFTKQLSLRYPFFLGHPNLMIVTPSVAIYDADIRSENNLGMPGRESKFTGDYKKFDYSISSKLFSGKTFPLSAYIRQGRRTTNNDLFSDRDITTESKGFTWNFYLDRLVYSYLPFFSINYNLTEVFNGKNPETDNYSETIDYNLKKAFSKILKLGYNYRIFDSNYYNYSYHRFTHDSYYRINRQLELNLKGK